jgi:predicted TIM-barrel fold metal-dependent hydrolase
MTRRVIDIHAILSNENHLSLTPSQLQERMEISGVELAAARSMGAALVVDNRVGNDALLQAGDNIRAWVTANPWYGPAAIDELKRCHDLDAVGLFLHPARQGFFPTEAVAEPLIAFADKVGWPVMIHTGTYVFADILAVAELAERHSSVCFIAGFGGFADQWFEVPDVMAETPNLFCDASMLWGGGLKTLIDRVGAGRILYGSAEPRNRYTNTIALIERLGLSESENKAIFSDNAVRVLELKK